MPKYPDVIAPSIFGKIDEKRGKNLRRQLNREYYYYIRSSHNETTKIKVQPINEQVCLLHLSSYRQSNT